MPKFKIGDRVKFKPKCGEFGSSLTFSSCFNPEFDDVMEHPYGTVRGFSDDDIIVEFDAIQTGHDCGRTVLSGRGFYVDYRELVLAAPKIVSISNLI